MLEILIGSGGGGTGCAASAEELSCHLTHTFSSLQGLSSSRSPSEESASQTSRRMPVGMSHTNVSSTRIRATARATRVPSIFPLSFVIRYSCTQSGGPLPSENFFL